MPETAAWMEPVPEAPSSVPQKFTQSLPIPVASSQQTSTPAPQVSSYLPQPNPLPTPVLLTFSQPEAFRQISPVVHLQPSAEQPQHLPYQPPPMPLPPMHQLHQQPFVAVASPPTKQASSSVQLQPTDFSHYSPRATRESTHIPPTSSFLSPPFQWFDNPYLKPPEQRINRPYMDFPPRPQLESNFNNLYAHGRGEYPLPNSNPTLESWNPMQSNISSGYSQLPTAQMLPEALPTVSIRDAETSSDRSGSGVPVNDIVDRVVAMGFRRDVVRATVKRITDRGQPVDVNVVLDMLDQTPSNARFG